MDEVRLLETRNGFGLGWRRNGTGQVYFWSGLHGRRCAASLPGSPGLVEGGDRHSRRKPLAAQFVSLASRPSSSNVLLRKRSLMRQGLPSRAVDPFGCTQPGRCLWKWLARSLTCRVCDSVGCAAHYVGLTKIHLQHLATAAALNVCVRALGFGTHPQLLLYFSGHDRRYHPSY